MVDRLSTSPDVPNVPAFSPTRQSAAPPEKPGGAPTPSPAEPPAVAVDIHTLPQSEIPPNTMNFESPQARLSRLLDEAMDALYQAASAVERQALVQKLKQTLAADTNLPDADLVAEKQRFLGQLSDLHEGVTRVYAAGSTQKVWKGIMQALGGAVEERHSQP